MNLQFVLLCIVCWFHHGRASYVIVTCKQNCKVNDRQISGGEGEDIALTYRVTTKAFRVVQIYYGVRLILSLWPEGDLLINPKHPSFVHFNDTKSHNHTYGFDFSFEILKLNRTLQDVHLISAVVLKSGETESDYTALNVLYQPKLVGEWKSRYEAKEHDDIDITFELSGNPKPNVTAQMAKVNLNVISHGTSPYKYRVPLINILRNQCGKYLYMEASGYKRKLEKLAKLNVSFIPNIPSDLSASHVNSSCVKVQWGKIESGDCVVHYTLSYEIAASNFTHHTESNIATVCYSSNNMTYNVTFRVNAQVGSHLSNLSEPLVVPIVPPTIPPPTTALQTTTWKPTTTATATTKATTTATTTRATTTTKVPLKPKNSIPYNKFVITTAILSSVIIVLAIVLLLICTGRIPLCIGTEKQTFSDIGVVNGAAVELQNSNSTPQTYSVIDNYENVANQQQSSVAEAKYENTGNQQNVSYENVNQQQQSAYEALKPPNQGVYANTADDRSTYQSLQPSLDEYEVPPQEQNYQRQGDIEEYQNMGHF